MDGYENHFRHRKPWADISPEARNTLDSALEMFLTKGYSVVGKSDRVQGLFELPIAPFWECSLANFLTERLPVLAGVRILNFAGIKFEPGDAEALVNSIHKFSSVSTLGLFYCELTADDIAIIAPHAHRLAGLEVLDLRENRFGPEGAIAFGKGSGPLPSLTELHLGENQIGDVGVAAIARNAHKWPRLKALDLGGNSIGSSGVIAFAEHAHTFGRLNTLFLGSGYPSIESARILGHKIHEEMVPPTIMVRRNKMGDAGAAALLKHADDLKSLVNLDLGDCDIESAETLVQLIGKLRKGGAGGGSLQDINISRNPLRRLDGTLVEMSGFIGGMQPVDQVLPTLTSAKSAAAHKVFDARVVLVGVGRNGKSQLAGALSGSLKKGERSQEYTRGFEMRSYSSWQADLMNTNVRLLDMGGQPEQFSLHYLLWERRRNAFLLVCDSLKEPGWSGNRVEYFLRAIQSKSTEEAPPPVLATLTMADQISRRNPAKTGAHSVRMIQKKVGISLRLVETPVDALNHVGLDALREAIDTAIAEIEPTAAAESFPGHRKNLQSIFGTVENPDLSVHEIPIERYLEMSREIGEMSDGVALNCLGVLHALGDVLWLKDHETLKHRIINVHWAGKAMYQLLTVPSAKRAGGIITGRDWTELLPDDRNGLVRKLMLALKLMKQTHQVNPETGDDETCYIVPDLMEYAPSKHAWAKAAPVCRREYPGFLWEPVFLQFVGDHAEEIDDDDRWAYRDEVKLKRYDGARALVRADYEHEPMAIWFHQDPSDTSGKSAAYCESLRDRLRTKDMTMDRQQTASERLTNPPPPPRDDDPTAVALDHLLAGVWMYRQQQDVRMWLTIVPVAMAIVSAVLLLAIPDNKVPGAVVAGVGVVVTFLSPLIGLVQKEKRTRAAKRFADFEDIVLRGKVEQCPAEYKPLAAKAKTIEGHPTVADWFVNLDQVTDSRLRPLAAALQETRFRTQEYWFAACTGAAVFAGCVVVSLMVAWLVKDEKFDQWKLFLALLPLASAGFVAAIHNVVAYVEFHKVQRKCFAVYAPYKKGKITSEELAEEAEEAYLKMQTARESYPPVAAWIYWRNRPICNDSAGDYPRKINRKERLGDRGED